MTLRKWEDLPKFMRRKEVREYYDILSKKRFSLKCKRIFDVVLSAIMLIILLPVFVILAVAIKLDSPGPVFYKQERVTQYGKKFKIYKFRTMVNNADKVGAAVTVGNDSRITRVGSKIRDYRLDEIGQLINVLKGEMSFVGTRPEVVKYVKGYTPEMLATLLLPAGITSEASIRYKDEARLLDAADDVDKVYIEQVLPGKMIWNLESIRRFRFLREILTMFRTAAAVMGKNYD
ncbi:Sugar transferase involved in LPS biosynthesis (colanic, teichoic acid) [Ruminococcus flavefaciens]|uniref:Sugar transferase involved in LPS biosynthesis (Colanic, teichoic acid) n=1 Tax=Ruminococcus flavefaciens TaxID=1265 RepID=A0A1H6KH96_RUMFL|nr:sugar transferase [Ruminococcus flavefaciens]SEH74954.1 Sugar transferase involved in LPS biosynthesis (colanic, teichoic acid) [Ruminococcus flavefaciens]